MTTSDITAPGVTPKIRSLLVAIRDSEYEDMTPVEALDVPPESRAGLITQALRAGLIERLDLGNGRVAAGTAGHRDVWVSLTPAGLAAIT